jgi:ABC-2 type transport system ATP-binding protein
MTPPLAIDCQHLTHRYGQFTAVDDLSLQVRCGETVGLLGPNGAGKTTVVRVLTTLTPVQSGHVFVFGLDSRRHTMDIRHNIGYVPQQLSIEAALTGRQNVELFARLYDVPRAQRSDRVDEALHAMQLLDVAEGLAGTYSGGMVRRLELAQALVNRPSLLILDEPTVGLDPRQIIEIRNLIKGLGGEHTVMLSTHILPEVSAICSRVIIINDGRVVAEDTPDNLTRRLRGADNLQIEVRGPRKEVLSHLKSLPRVLDVQAGGGADGRASYTVACELGADVREQVAAAVVAKGWGLLELRPVGMSLEEIFLKLTTTEEAA